MASIKSYQYTPLFCRTEAFRSKFVHEFVVILSFTVNSKSHRGLTQFFFCGLKLKHKLIFLLLTSLYDIVTAPWCRLVRSQSPVLLLSGSVLVSAESEIWSMEYGDAMEFARFCSHKLLVDQALSLLKLHVFIPAACCIISCLIAASLSVVICCYLL